VAWSSCASTTVIQASPNAVPVDGGGSGGRSEGVAEAPGANEGLAVGVGATRQAATTIANPASTTIARNPRLLLRCMGAWSGMGRGSAVAGLRVIR
jgi:hypothetical protein